MVDKTKRVAEGLSDLLGGLEYHYPGEMNEENLAKMLPVLAAGSTDGVEHGEASRRGSELSRERAARRARGRML